MSFFRGRFLSKLKISPSGRNFSIVQLISKRIHLLCYGDKPKKTWKICCDDKMETRRLQDLHLQIVIQLKITFFNWKIRIIEDSLMAYNSLICSMLEVPFHD